MLTVRRCDAEIPTTLISVARRAADFGHLHGHSGEVFASHPTGDCITIDLDVDPPSPITGIQNSAAPLHTRSLSCRRLGKVIVSVQGVHPSPVACDYGRSVSSESARVLPRGSAIYYDTSTSPMMAAAGEPASKNPRFQSVSRSSSDTLQLTQVCLRRADRT